MTEASASGFEALIEKHARLVAAAIRRVCGRRHRALIPDVQQEVYLALWKHLRRGNRIDYPTSYIYKVALTTALAVIRKLSPADGVPAEERDLERPDDRTSWSIGLLPAERARLIQEVLGRLEPDEARALRAYLAGFNHKETAELYGWSQSVARHRIYRTIEALARRLKAESAGNKERFQMTTRDRKAR